ncbi:hypothetical protein FQA47_007602 [Oryzias melastigma]|uniref:Uncharacterized protein n=1 Tax=Oryzias melastigma TaxID=30732 RepID=A0A834BY83_ORYME|nr:hypothetical protein FQA47_007602 [Oryzias melastigma]
MLGITFPVWECQKQQRRWKRILSPVYIPSHLHPQHVSTSSNNPGTVTPLGSSDGDLPPSISNGFSLTLLQFSAHSRLFYEQTQSSEGSFCASLSLFSDS